MTVHCDPSVSAALKASVQARFGASAADNGHSVFLFEGSTANLGDRLPDLSSLGAGMTVAIANAPAGPLFGEQFPQCRALSKPSALLAISSVEIPGRDELATSLCVLPVPGEGQTGSLASDDGSHDLVPAPPVAAPSADQLAQTLLIHCQTSFLGDTDLLPPPGATYAVVQVPLSWSQPFSQNFWKENSGATQTVGSGWTLVFYFYFADGDPDNQQYFVLAVQSGTAVPVQGTGLCDDSNNERVFVLASNKISIDVLAGSMSLAGCTPTATQTSPVSDSIELPMSVLAYAGGGKVPTAFTASRSELVPNEDWGVMNPSQGGGTVNQATVEYYNVTGWDASSDAPFSDWWGQMYTNNNVKTLDAQCRTGASFDSMAAWTVPYQPSGTPAQLVASNFLGLAGFANPNGSGNGHHQMIDYSWGYAWDLPAWDLNAVVGMSS